MNEERTVSVNVEITLSFEIERNDEIGCNNADIAAESAIMSLKGYLARYPYGRVEGVERSDSN